MRDMRPICGVVEGHVTPKYVAGSMAEVANVASMYFLAFLRGVDGCVSLILAMAWEFLRALEAEP